MSPKPGSVPAEAPASPADSPAPEPSVPAWPPLAPPLEGAPPEAPPVAGLPPEALLDEPLLEVLPPLELCEPDWLEELLVLGLLAPPEGEEAPELEEGGVGTEGVVGVLAEGQPINTKSAAATHPVASARRPWRIDSVWRLFIRVVVPRRPVWGPDQKTR